VVGSTVERGPWCGNPGWKGGAAELQKEIGNQEKGKKKERKIKEEE